MTPSTNKTDAISTMSQLSIDPSKKPSDKSKSQSKPQKPVVDSWEDEDLSDPDEDGSVRDTEPSTGPTTPSRNHIPSPPPPTPISPVASYSSGSVWPSTNDPGYGGTTSPTGPETSTRPEKTDAVARRMIAAGLGIKAPKQTEEQKAYQKAMKDQEKKRRELEKAAEQKKRDDAEKAKTAIWDD